MGLLDFKLSPYSSFSLCLVFRHTSENPKCRIQRPNPKVSLECPPLSIPVSLKCPTPEFAGECPWSAQGFLGVLTPSPECPTPECFLECRPLSVPGGPNPRVSLEGGDVSSEIVWDAGGIEAHDIEAPGTPHLGSLDPWGKDTLHSAFSLPLARPRQQRRATQKGMEPRSASSQLTRNLTKQNPLF